jgi:cytochrome P450
MIVQADRHKHAWVPFGAGQRQCIGRDMSIIETQIVLAMLLQRFRIAAVPGRVVQPKRKRRAACNRPAHIETIPAAIC